MMKMVTLEVPEKHAETLTKYLKKLTTPPKPVKRDVKFSDADLATILDRVRFTKMNINLVQRECNRLYTIYNRPRSEEDSKWIDKQISRLEKVLDAADATCD